MELPVLPIGLSQSLLILSFDYSMYQVIYLVSLPVAYPAHRAFLGNHLPQSRSCVLSWVPEMASEMGPVQYLTHMMNVSPSLCLMVTEQQVSK